jgi:hypothetical protein
MVVTKRALVVWAHSRGHFLGAIADRLPLTRLAFRVLCGPIKGLDRYNAVSRGTFPKAEALAESMGVIFGATYYPELVERGLSSVPGPGFHAKLRALLDDKGAMEW